MSPRRFDARRARAARVVIALAAVSATLGAVALAATRPEGRAGGIGGHKPLPVGPKQVSAGQPRDARLPTASFIEVPRAASTAAEPQFRFHVVSRARPLAPAPPRSSPGATSPRRFQCRLDAGGWSACKSPYRLTGLSAGGHSFAARALSRSGLAGPPASYSWMQVEDQIAPPPTHGDPMPFSIESPSGGVEGLYPGNPPQELAVRILNPNPVPIEVTGLSVAIASAPPGCPAENFLLTPASVSAVQPVTVPASGSVELPTATNLAPTIRMLDLPFNQDSCRGAEVELAFSGEARG